MSQHVLRPTLGAIAVAAFAVLALVPASALAHEHRTIDSGTYSVIVGWQTEPPIQGQPNAATVQVSLATTDPPQPVEGAEQTLSLQLRQGRTTLQLPLHTVMGNPGSYAADVVPDQVGDAQLTLSGSINGDPVEEVFDTADGKFDAVEASQAPQDGAEAASTHETHGIPVHDPGAIGMTDH